MPCGPAASRNMICENFYCDRETITAGTNQLSYCPLIRHNQGPLLSASLLKSTAIVSGMTLISRLFGYVRDMVVAVVFGASGLTDAFFVAFRIPNLFRRMFAEGAFSLAFVPVFSEYREKHSQQELRDLADHTAGALALVLALVTATGILAAPLVIRLFAPGFETGGERYELAVQMLRITFPYLFFISLTALAAGILNSYNRFAVPAFTPVLLNLSLITASLWLAPLMEQPVLALSWGVLIAGMAQLSLQVPALLRIGLLPIPKFKRGDEGVKKILDLMLPALFGSSVAQLNILINTLIASFLITGSISWLYYSDRFVELPLALFGVAIGTVILPKLSRDHSNASADEFSGTLGWALRLTLLMAIPAMVGLIALAGPILITLIEYGAFNPNDAFMSSLSLMAYALGVPAFMLVKILAPGFYSRQDSRTPVRIGIMAVIANILLNVFIVLPWYLSGTMAPHAGLALATALAGYLNAGLLYRRLRQEQAYQGAAGNGLVAARLLIAGLIMGAALYYLSPNSPTWYGWAALERALHLGGLILSGATVYFASLAAMGLRPRHFAKPS
jgi:putative peptidoglycan lipid II flippase